MFTVFGILPRFLKNWLESGNLVCNSTAGTKTALGIIQLWFNYLAESFLKALGNVNVKCLKIPKKHRRRYAARVFETPGLDSTEPWPPLNFHLGFHLKLENKFLVKRPTASIMGSCIGTSPC